MAIDNTKVPKPLYTSGHDVYNSDLESQRDNAIIEMLYRVITSNGRFGVIDTKVRGTKLWVTPNGGYLINISPGFALDGWGKRTGLLVAYTKSLVPADIGKYICIKAVTTVASARSHPVTGVGSNTRENLDTSGASVIELLATIPPANINDYIVLDKIINVGAMVELASGTMTDADFAKIRKVFSAQSVWWNQSGPSGTSIAPSVSDGCTLEEYLACKGTGIRTITNPLGLTMDDIGASIFGFHLRGSHRTGIHPRSDLNRDALRPQIVGGTIVLGALQAGEYLQIDNMIRSSSDISSYTISFAAPDYGQDWTIYFDHIDTYPKKILRSLESTLVNGELKVCWVTLDISGNIDVLVDHDTGTGGPYRQEAFFSTKARDIGMTGHVLKWFTVGAQESGLYIYDVNTIYDNSIFLNKGIILIPASGNTPQVKSVVAVTAGGSPPSGSYESYKVATAWSPVPVVGDLVGIFELEDLGYDDLQRIIDKIWGRFHSVTGHAHTGLAGEGPKILSSGIAPGAITDTGIGNRTISQTLAGGSLTGSLTSLLGWMATAIKNIKGTTNFWDSAAASLATIWDKFAATSGAGGHMHTGVLGDGPVLPPPTMLVACFKGKISDYTNSGTGTKDVTGYSEEQDVGGNFDPTTGTFVTPHAGLYHFQFSAAFAHDSAIGTISAQVYAGTSVYYLQLWNNADVYIKQRATDSVYINLSAGVSVKIRVVNNLSSAFHLYQATFLGALVNH